MAGITEVLTLDTLDAWCAQQNGNLSNPDFTKPLKATKLIVVEDIRDNFQGSHDPNGQPWPPLKKARTLGKFSKKHRKNIEKKRREDARNHDQPLRDRGFLMAASTTGLSEQLSSIRLVLTNNLEYAAAQNYGALIHVPEKRRPKGEKPWVFPDASDNAIFTRKIKAHDIRIPARTFSGISPHAQDTIVRLFADHVTGQL